jgi:alkaline phosphatase D
MEFRSSRRGFLKTTVAGLTVLALGSALSGCTGGSFAHGVASGDPSRDGVVLWTRITPSAEGEVPVLWELAKDREFRQRVGGGIVKTDASVDYTIKVDVTGLAPGRDYFYRFRSADGVSPIGQTRTLPRGHVASFRLGVVSCAHYVQGYFHAYRELAARTDLDLVLHLGDYIYETGNPAGAVRNVSPDQELLDLAAYRQRYASYRADPALQELHARHPFVLVWDDHEVANNAWRDGALGHGEDEGDYTARRAAAFQAYYEWLPIREPARGERSRIFRALEVGDLLHLHVLDTRHFGRERAPNLADYIAPQTGVVDEPRLQSDLSAPRDLLGEEQRAWLEAGLAASATTWQALAQQVLLAPMWMPAPLVTRQVTFAQYAALEEVAATNPAALTAAQRRVLAAPLVPYNLDAWDGYANERRWLLDTAEELDLNLLVLSGDSHNAWASNLASSASAAVGVEIACPSISSRGLEELLPGQPPATVATGARKHIPSLRFADTEHRGYVVVSLTHDEASVDWCFIDSAKTATYSRLPELDTSLRVRPGPEGRRWIDEG